MTDPETDHGTNAGDGDRHDAGGGLRAARGTSRGTASSSGPPATSAPGFPAPICS